MFRLRIKMISLLLILCVCPLSIKDPQLQTQPGLA